MVALPELGNFKGYVLTDQIKVIDSGRRVFRVMGRVSSDVMVEVRAQLASLLGIPVSS
jgi:mRNA-degrading endonuclease toxin of MazEF toxin-antitoxin module